MSKFSIVRRGVLAGALAVVPTLGAVSFSVLTAAPAHAVANCVEIGDTVDPVDSGHCAPADDTEPGNVFSVTVEVAEPDPPNNGGENCDNPPTPNLAPDGGTGVAVCDGNGNSVEAYMTGMLPAPQGEMETCALVVGCTGIESSTSDGAE